MDVYQELISSIVEGIENTIDECILMTKQGYELKTETWLDLTAEYGQQRRWKQYWIKTNN